MNEPTPIRIRPKLYQEMEAERPEIFTDTTTWGNYLLRVGLNYHMGLDPCGRLKTERPTEKETKGEKVFYTSKVDNIINKEKTKKEKKWVFTKEQIPDFPFKSYKSLIVRFWEVKKGFHTEDAFKLLIGEKGLAGIYRNHGETVVKDQLEEGIANKWQSITLKNYEAFGRPQKADKEPVTGHPAQRLWKDGGFVD